MTFLLFDGPAWAETRVLRFGAGLFPDCEVVVCFWGGEADCDGGGGDGFLEGVPDASAAALAALRAATALSIVKDDIQISKSGNYDSAQATATVYVHCEVSP